jgi:mRNA-degrading endonuclease RelE of RelBE toxin-antitoxin system
LTSSAPSFGEQRQRLARSLATSARRDIKRHSGDPPEWRLRVGDWRVRFTRDPDERVVVIQRVLRRGRAYRD